MGVHEGGMSESLSLAPKLVLLGLLRCVDWKLHKMCSSCSTW